MCWLFADPQCTLAPEVGPCRARIRAYFFNTTSRRCERFFYGGCGGNANRYRTADECAASCCPYKGMVHSDCAPCLRTCREPDRRCTAQCVSGCGCPRGTVLDERRRECVPPRRCPSRNKPLLAVKGSICVFFTGRLCPVEGQVFQRCRTCPATCSNRDLVCTLDCVPGCGCPPGQLIDTVNNKCVRPDQCPPDCSVSFMASVVTNNCYVVEYCSGVMTAALDVL